MIGSTTSCDFYSTTSSTDSATVNYATCEPITLCPGDYIEASSCTAGACTGDQYLILVDKSGLEIEHEDDGCGTTAGCSKLIYTVPSSAPTCSPYAIREGCYLTNTCSGIVTVTITCEW